MRNFLLFLIALSGLIAQGEPEQEIARAKRVLDLLFAKRGSWIVESNPERWKPELWQKSGISEAAWEKAIAQWAQANQEGLTAGVQYRDQYREQIAKEAAKALEPLGFTSPATNRVIRDYVAFLASQKKATLGKPTDQQAEQAARVVMLPLEMYMQFDDSPELRDEYKREFGRAKRRAEESEFPSTDIGVKEQAWKAWRDRNESLSEKEILARFRAALKLAESAGVTARAGIWRLTDSNFDSYGLRVNWATGKLETKSGKTVTFAGTPGLAAELTGFLADFKSEPAGAPDAARDAKWAAVRSLRREASALVETTRFLRKVDSKSPVKEVRERLFTLQKDLREAMSPEGIFPLERLAHGPVVDDKIEAAIWNGYRQSPKYFKKRDGWFRLSFSLSEIAQGKPLKRWKALTAIAVGLTAGYETTKPYHEDILDNVVHTAQDLGRSLQSYLPRVDRLWGDGSGDLLKDSQLDLPSAGFGENGPLPPNHKVFEVTKGSNVGETIDTVKIADRGFSKVPTQPYEFQTAAKDVPDFIRNHPSYEAELKSLYFMRTERGKLLIPHIEGAFLKNVSIWLEPRAGGPEEKVTITLPITRSQDDFYVVDLKSDPALAKKYDISKAKTLGTYFVNPPEDYLRDDLKIDSPERVEALARHYEEAGLGRIAEGFREEAKGMREFHYAIFPSDVERILESGSLYSKVRNPRNGLRLPKTNILKGLDALPLEQHLCTQCAGSAESAKRALAFLYEGRPVNVKIRSVFQGLSTPGHAQVEVWTDKSPRKVIVDSTAKRMDPRNEAGWKNLAAIPKDDVLHSPNQDRAFAPEFLPAFPPPALPSEPETAPKEAPKTPEKHADRKRSLPSVAEMTASSKKSHDDLWKALLKIDLYHRFRNPGDPELEEEKPPREKIKTKSAEEKELELEAEASLDPRIRLALADLERARRELLKDSAFAKLPLGDRLATFAIPLSALIRDTLLGRQSPEVLLGVLQDRMPEGSPLAQSNDLSALLRELAKNERAKYENILNHASDPAMYRVRDVASPVLVDKILGVFDTATRHDPRPPAVQPAEKCGFRWLFWGKS